MTERVCDYKLFKDSTVGALTYDVKTAIDYGWQPYGSPMISQDGYFCQAVVRYVYNEDGGPL